ncbi:MAG TPA: HEPN domain-containing protein [Chloroflexota bacterium]|nr:HEPN domain-containing protein [Chloroflexota bacterium]
MPSERFAPDDPREWLNRARSNLTRAKTPVPDVYLEDLCFDAQQAAEKAIKAVLIHRRLDFPYVHDLAELLSLLQQAGARVPRAVKRAANLTQYAIMTRYPGLAEPVSREDHQRAVRIAEETVGWAEGTIDPGGEE